MNHEEVVVIDSGASNVRGVNNAVRQLGFNSLISNSPNDLREANKIILPGVGSFDAAMTALIRTGMSELIRERAESGTHILGICLGMQLLVSGSAEGSEEGLNLIKGYVEPIRQKPGLRVPHLGWNDVTVKNPNPLIASGTDLRFYFNHSFAIYDLEDGETMLEVNYGEDFVAGIRKGNVFGVQFHPEKSHQQGRTLIKRFLEY